MGAVAGAQRGLALRALLQAMRLRRRLEIQDTPNFGSEFNLAEIELRVLSRQCLDHRLPVRKTLRREVTQWYLDRNARQKGMDWRFTTQDACIKLQHFYPEIQLE